jgi:hypothetical protein
MWFYNYTRSINCTKMSTMYAAHYATLASTASRKIQSMKSSVTAALVERR